MLAFRISPHHNYRRQKHCLLTKSSTDLSNKCVDPFGLFLQRQRSTDGLDRVDLLCLLFLDLLNLLVCRVEKDH